MTFGRLIDRPSSGGCDYRAARNTSRALDLAGTRARAWAWLSLARAGFDRAIRADLGRVGAAVGL